MQKINFQDLPSTTTPINASNMNTLQTNVENAISNATLFSQMFNIPNEGIGSGTNVDNLYDELGIKAYSIWGSLPISMPSDAYAYGTLIVITQSTSLTGQFLNSQIYIPSNPSSSGGGTQRGIYFRTSTDNWLKLTGSSVSKTTS